MDADSDTEEDRIPVISNGTVNLVSNDPSTTSTSLGGSIETGAENVGETSGGASDSLGLLQEMRVDSINGCDEEVQEWEELEFLVDSGASATVVGKDQVRAVKASEPDPNRWYKMADGNIIQNRGEKLFRAGND